MAVNLIAATVVAVSLVPSVLGYGERQAAPKRGEAFELKVNEGLQLADDKLRIRFDRVSEDSRCPVGVQCVWAGDAVVDLTLERPPAAAESRALHTNPRLGQQTEYAGLVVRLVKLEPPLREGATIAPDEYRVTLVVDRNPKGGL